MGRWVVLLLLSAFLLGLAPCLSGDLTDGDYVPATSSGVSHSAESCRTSAVLCTDQAASHRFVPASSLLAEGNALNEGIRPRPPFPPPRA